MTVKLTENEEEEIFKAQFPTTGLFLDSLTDYSKNGLLETFNLKHEFVFDDNGRRIQFFETKFRSLKTFKSDCLRLFAFSTVIADEFRNNPGCLVQVNWFREFMLSAIKNENLNREKLIINAVTGLEFPTEGLQCDLLLPEVLKVFGANLQDGQVLKPEDLAQLRKQIFKEGKILKEA